MFITIAYIRYSTGAQISYLPSCNGPDFYPEGIWNIFIKWQVLTFGIMFGGKSVVL